MGSHNVAALFFGTYCHYAKSLDAQRCPYVTRREVRCTQRVSWHPAYLPVLGTVSTPSLSW